MKRQGVELLIVELTGYDIHLDLSFLMVDKDLALVNPFGLPYSFMEELKARGVRLVEIDPADDPWINNSLATAPGRLLMPEGANNSHARRPCTARRDLDDDSLRGDAPERRGHPLLDNAAPARQGLRPRSRRQPKTTIRASEGRVTDLPKRAQVVIVGGGIVGCSVAYHLTLRGCTDVLLLERKQLTCGTTWHAAGLVGQLRATRNLTMLAQYTTELYATLEKETGQATGFRQIGSLAVATSDGRMEELKRGASMARSFGLQVDVVSAERALALWPFLNADDLLGAVHLPRDGQTNPIDTTQALAKGARSRGARLVEDAKVDQISSKTARPSAFEGPSATSRPTSS